jgi:hypothetical protein
MAMRFIIALLALMWFLIIIGAVKYKQEVTALAYNCYFEARNSTTEDQIATMVTVMNRGTPSVEVYKKDQFSWTNEYAEPADNPALDKCKALAKMVYNNHNLFKSKDICKHYAAVSAKFGEGHWTKTFKRRTQIGKHYYYCN